MSVNADQLEAVAAIKSSADVVADQLEAIATVKSNAANMSIQADQLEAIAVVYSSEPNVPGASGVPPTGSNYDIRQRIKMLMPNWFGQQYGNATPVLDAFLTGPGTALGFVYKMIAFVKKQTRLSTASGGWLDLFAQDFFGTDLLRNDDEDDDTYRARIKAALFSASNTKAALVAALALVSDATPIFTEWWRADESGVWDGDDGAGRMFWDVDTDDTPFHLVSPGVFLEIDETDSETRRLIFVALTRKKAEGVTIWVKFSSD